MASLLVGLVGRGDICKRRHTEKETDSRVRVCVCVSCFPLPLSILSPVGVVWVHLLWTLSALALASPPRPLSPSLIAAAANRLSDFQITISQIQAPSSRRFSLFFLLYVSLSSVFCFVPASFVNSRNLCFDRILGFAASLEWGVEASGGVFSFYYLLIVNIVRLVAVSRIPPWMLVVGYVHMFMLNLQLDSAGCWICALFEILKRFIREVGFWGKSER